MLLGTDKQKRKKKQSSFVSKTTEKLIFKFMKMFYSFLDMHNYTEVIKVIISHSENFPV